MILHCVFLVDFSGQQQGHVRSDRSRSTPGSGILPLDMERDPPTGGSGRFKRPRLSGSFRSSSPQIFDNSSPGLDSVGCAYNFSNQGGNLQNTLSQFDLMEETQRDTPQEFNLHVSSALLQ
ncbi:hypothetical protein Mapa_000375 [Marchantia paleacea]|nr:hypothetical protein Mapa_000375 [Marchantia paleacea]